MRTRAPVREEFPALQYAPTVTPPGITHLPGTQSHRTRTHTGGKQVHAFTW